MTDELYTPRNLAMAEVAIAGASPDAIAGVERNLELAAELGRLTRVFSGEELVAFIASIRTDLATLQWIAQNEVKVLTRELHQPAGVVCFVTETCATERGALGRMVRELERERGVEYMAAWTSNHGTHRLRVRRLRAPVMPGPISEAVH